MILSSDLKVIVIGDVTRRRHASDKAAPRLSKPPSFFLPFPHHLLSILPCICASRDAPLAILALGVVYAPSACNTMHSTRAWISSILLDGGLLAMGGHGRASVGSWSGTFVRGCTPSLYLLILMAHALSIAPIPPCNGEPEVAGLGFV